MLKRISGLAAITTLALASPALADDRPPTPEERTQIEQVLEREGFVTWSKIEFDIDDNYWEVDDANTADNVEYDLKLAAGTFEIIERDRDD